MNKQIEEYIAVIEIEKELCGKPCDICKANNEHCMPHRMAKKLATKGWRKSSDVAREIFDAIYGISIGCSVENDVMRLTFEKDPYVLVVLASEFDKLRKKYESEGGE